MGVTPLSHFIFILLGVNGGSDPYQPSVAAEMGEVEHCLSVTHNSFFFFIDIESLWKFILLPSPTEMRAVAKYSSDWTILTLLC